MSTENEKVARRLAWPDVAALGIVAAVAVLGGAMLLACLGKWPL